MTEQNQSPPVAEEKDLMFLKLNEFSYSSHTKEIAEFYDAIGLSSKETKFFNNERDERSITPGLLEVNNQFKSNISNDRTNATLAPKEMLPTKIETIFSKGSDVLAPSESAEQFCLKDPEKQLFLSNINDTDAQRMKIVFLAERLGRDNGSRGFEAMQTEASTSKTETLSKVFERNKSSFVTPEQEKSDNFKYLSNSSYSCNQSKLKPGIRKRKDNNAVHTFVHNPSSHNLWAGKSSALRRTKSVYSNSQGEGFKAVDIGVNELSELNDNDDKTMLNNSNEVFMNGALTSYIPNNFITEDTNSGVSSLKCETSCSTIYKNDVEFLRDRNTKFPGIPSIVKKNVPKTYSKKNLRESIARRALGYDSNGAALPGTFVCEEPSCKKLFGCAKSRSRHFALNHKSRKKFFFCKICKQAYVSKENLIKHNGNCHDPQLEKKFCDLCEAHFSSAFCLQSHKNNKHKIRKRISKALENVCFVCPICQETTLEENNMMRHIHIVHEKKQNRVFSCAHCGVEKNTKSNLKAHINSVHRKSEFNTFCTKETQ